MAKDVQFRAYDLRRRRRHTIPSPPVKITKPHLERQLWIDSINRNAASGVGKVSKRKKTKTKAKAKARARARAKTKTKTKTKTKGKAKSPKKKVPQRVSDVLRYKSCEYTCLECGKTGDDVTCGIQCYRKFRKEQFKANLIDIKGPGELGYGAFTKPGAVIEKGAWLDEYVGDLIPMDVNTESLYRVVIPEVCAVDAERAGNWTRFINSHCQPNVKLWGEHIGKRHVTLFQAFKDIEPEEEIVFNYGASYFEHAGFECECDAFDEPHLPGSKKKK